MIDELVSLNVNGIEQWVLIRGRDPSRTVVLFVHGGPAYPLMWFSRAFDGSFIDDFVVVHWDQRHAGKSYSATISPHPLTLSQIAADGLQVAEHVLQRLGADQLILVGHSWGTMVAARMAQQCPTLFRAYVSVGTSAHWTRAYQLRYAHLQEVARRDGNLRALRQLAELGPPPYVSSRTVEQFGQLVWEIDGFSGTARQLTADDLAAAIERSTEYSRDEIATSLVAMQDNLDRFGEFLKGYSMIDSVPKLEVPIYFVEGQYDRNCPIALSREYFEALEAPSGKHWNLFAESAHMPMYEEPQRFLRLLKSIVPV